MLKQSHRLSQRPSRELQVCLIPSEVSCPQSPSRQNTSCKSTLFSSDLKPVIIELNSCPSIFSSPPAPWPPRRGSDPPLPPRSGNRMKSSLADEGTGTLSS